jgi:outer membrane protein assembly factor BamB
VEIGEGYSSPVVSNGRIFVHSRRDPEEIVTALSLADGKVLWQQKYPAAFQKNQYAVKMAKGPNSTPLIIGQRLFTLGVTGVLHAWDTVSGRQIWSQDYSSKIDTSKMFCGTAASPLALADLVVIQVGSDIHGGQMLALDPVSGKIVWEWKGPGPGYASPVLVNIEGSQQIVALTNNSLVGVDPKNGAGLWSIAFPDEWHENIATPVWTGKLLVVSGPRQGTHAFSLTSVDGRWEPKEVWKNPEVTMYMSSPVFGDGVIYGHSVKRKGQFVALNADSGAALWSTDGREGDHASLLLTPRNLIYLTNGGDLIVARRSATGFASEHRYEVAESETWATPVLIGPDILIRDATGVARLSVK